MEDGGNFMESPLVAWVQTFRSEPASYQELCDGAFLNDVIHQIDDRSCRENVLVEVEGAAQRLNNWQVVLTNILTYYKEVLQQLVVMKLPDLILISKEKDTYNARGEIEKVLLLLLGCAVQCEQQETFITNIQRLPVDVQQGIVEFIKEITDREKHVFALEYDEDDMDESHKLTYQHLCRLLRERDEYILEIHNLNQTLDEIHQSQLASVNQSPPGGAGAAPRDNTPEKSHLSVQLAESRTKLFKLRQELEDKNEVLAELQEDLTEIRENSAKLRTENLELTRDARAARSYRDELDIFREKATRLDKCEAELAKYKEKLSELDYFKSRVEELREENTILIETRGMLEEQLSSSHGRIKAVLEVEEELVSYKQQVNRLVEEREIDRQRIQDLSEENARLDMEKKSSFTESASLEEELAKARLQRHKGMGNSLDEQMSETTNAKMLRLELERQRLAQQLEELKETQVLEAASRTLELEKEQGRLCRKVEELQEASERERHQLLSMEHQLQQAQRKLHTTEETLTVVRENTEQQNKEFQREKDQLQNTVTSLRHRNEKTNDLRVRDLEQENRKLHESLNGQTKQVAKLEGLMRQKERVAEKSEEHEEKVESLETENSQLERKVEELQHSLTTLKYTCEQYEKAESKNSVIEVEKLRLDKMVQALQKKVDKAESCEQENIRLSVELQHCKRALESAKASTMSEAELLHDKDALAKEVTNLKNTLEKLRKSTGSRQAELEAELTGSDTENQKLRRSLETATRRLTSLERESSDLSSQNQMLSKSVESLRSTVRRLEDVEQGNQELEQEHLQVQKDKAHLDKENRRLKQSLEMKEASLEELHSKLSVVERDNKVLKKEIVQKTEVESRLEELEKHNMQLIQQSRLEKKTISNLREDLVGEKIKTQQLGSEREKLNSELTKLGLDVSKLQDAEHSNEDSKFLALESKMNDAFKRSLSLKEERITALEGRLDESKTRNLKLQQEITGLRRSYEGLQQRREEEALVATPRTRAQNNQISSTREILELKDHLITVERTNAVLESERTSLQQKVSSLKDHLSQLRSETEHLQRARSSAEGQSASLHSQLAKMQVDYSTLATENSEMRSNNVGLQKDLAQVEARYKDSKKSLEALNEVHDNLNSDHNQLQKLHEHLSGEYEALLSEHGSLKSNFKSVKAELKEIHEKNSLLIREKETVVHLKQALDKDKQNMQFESKSLGSLQHDYIRLKEENVLLQSANDKSGRDYHDLFAEHKAAKNSVNQLRLQVTELQGTLARCREQLSTAEVDLSKMSSKCEYIEQLNTKLEEDNRSLLQQVQTLLTQNHELLTQSLASKDMLASEQKNYLGRVADLQRQKDRLEEKIMDQYKRYDPVKKKNRSFGANFVRRAKQMLTTEKGAARRSRSKDRAKSMGTLLIHDSFDSSTISTNEDEVNRRASTGLYMSQLDKNLTRSTTALHQSSSHNSKLKGAKSVENLSKGLSFTDSFHSNSEWPVNSGRRRKVMGSTGNLHQSFSLGRGEDEDDDESGEEISLDQFLAECNRSPKARRKLLVEKRVELDESSESSEFTKDFDSSVFNRKDSTRSKGLDPSLGARPPLIELKHSELNSSQSSHSLGSSQDNHSNHSAQSSLLTSPDGVPMRSHHDPSLYTSTPRPSSNTPRQSVTTPRQSTSTPHQSSNTSNTRLSNSSISSESAFRPYGSNNGHDSLTGTGPGHNQQRHLPQAPGDPYSATSRPPPDSQDTQYNPGNVRSLSYQMSLKQQRHPGHPQQQSSPGSEEPVAPPRRSRPMSAGPLSSRNSTSSFSLPQRPRTPNQNLSSSSLTAHDYHNNTSASNERSVPNHAPMTDRSPSGAGNVNISQSVEMHLHSGPRHDNNPVQPKIMSRPDSQLGRMDSSGGRGRTLPQTPTDRGRTMRPGSTPPRPGPTSRLNGTDEQPKKPNPLWYEYGCV